MILVTGATGTTGSEVVRQLAARGEKVRALTRDPARAAVPPGVEVVRGDYLDADSLSRAMSGATAAYLVGVPDGEAQHDRALVAAARVAGVPRLVLLSAIATGDPDVGPFGMWHALGEEAVKESGAEWTVLRPSTFASNTLGWARAVTAGEPVPNMTGEGAQGVIDPRDVSEVAARALTEGRWAGRTYTLTGPEALTVPDQAAVLAAVLGRPVTTRDLSPDETLDHLRTAWGLDESGAEAVLTASAYVRDGRSDLVTDDVPEVLGRQARTFREWAQDHQGAFTAE
ncbi:NAD(P)H-binding protein [Streptomyces sp. NPDC101151]|uniref:NAD(P)H-binding protein n=1 Tax=Streptomyces sp. NPDC101151 TaxID=3366115 RepID=UPI003816D963